MASTAALDELRRIQSRINRTLSEVTDMLHIFPGKGMDDQGITQVMGTMLATLPESRQRIAERQEKTEKDMPPRSR